MEVIDHKVIGFMAILQFEWLKIVSERLKMNRVKKKRSKIGSKQPNQRKKTTENEVSFGQNDMSFYCVVQNDMSYGVTFA